MAKNSVRIRLKAYEHRILDASAEKIVKAAQDHGAKKIVGPSAETIDSLSRLELPSGVDIEIKL